MSSPSNLNGFDPFEGIEQTNPVVKASDEIASDVSKMKKSANAPIETNSTQNHEGVAKVDPDNPALGGILNNYRSETLDGLGSAYQQKTENFSAQDVRDLSRAEDGKLKINENKVLGDLSDALGFNVTSNEAFKGDLSDELFKVFKDLTDPDGGQLLDKNGNVLSFKDGWRKGTTEGLIYSLALAGVDIYKEVKDSALIDSFDAASLYSAAQQGMVEAYRPIYDKIDGEDKKVFMMVEAIQYVLTNGDYHSLIEMTNILGVSRYPLIKARYPKLVSTFLSNFKLDKAKDFQHHHQTICDNTVGLFTQIFGEDWLKINTSFGLAVNGLIGSNISSDAVTVFKLNESMLPMITIKGIFTEQDAVDWFYQKFSETPKLSIL